MFQNISLNNNDPAVHSLNASIKIAHALSDEVIDGYAAWFNLSASAYLDNTVNETYSHKYLALIDKVNKQDRDLKNEFKYSGWNNFTDDISSFLFGN